MKEPKTRRRFAQEFKHDVVNLVLEQGYSSAEVGRRLGVHENNINRWVREFRAKKQRLTPDGLSREQLQAELKRLQKLL